MHFKTLYKRRALLLSALAPIAFAAGCGGSGGGGGSTVDPRAVPTFAFVSNRDGNQEIYLARNNAQNQIRLTNSAGADITPSVSPDGTKVVFSSNRDGNSEIYTVNFDGTGLQRLTADSGTTLPQDTQPVYSPNGQYIAWISTRGGRANVWVMEATGDNQQRLTNLATNVVSSPGWAPNSASLVFVESTAVVSNLRLVNLNSGTITTTAATEGDIITSPSFNGAGTKIAYTVQPRRDGTSRSRVLDIPTGNVANGPTSGFAEVDKISWSRTNDLLIFGGSNATSSGNQIFATNAAGTETTRLTTVAQNFQPSF